MLESKDKDFLDMIFPFFVRMVDSCYVPSDVSTSKWFVKFAELCQNIFSVGKEQEWYSDVNGLTD